MKQIWTILLVVGVLSCSKDDNSLQECKVEISRESLFDCSPHCSSCEPVAEYYFKAEINGIPVLMELNDSSEVNNRLIGYSLGVQCKGSFYTSIFNNSSGNSPSVAISFYNIAYLDQPCDETDFNEIFLSKLTPGQYPFGFSNQDGQLVGVSFIEKNGDSWNTAFGSNDGFMTVTANIDLGLDTDGRKQNKVIGTFGDFYLYNTSNSTEAVLVSNAEFSYLFKTEL